MADEKTPEDVEADVDAPEETETVAADEAAADEAPAEETAAEEPVAEEAPAEKKPRRSRRKAAEPAEEPVAEEAAEAEDAGEEPEAEEKPRRRSRRRSSEPEEKPAKQRRRVEYAPGEAPVGRAQAKYVRTSARKARLVCDHIRGKSVVEARAILAHTPRAVAADWEKLLSSAVANAEHNHELIGDELRILSITADEGPTLKRFRPRAKGRADRIRKRTSHLSIALTPED
jgi:ribosomal protein L22